MNAGMIGIGNSKYISTNEIADSIAVTVINRTLLLIPVFVLPVVAAPAAFVSLLMFILLYININNVSGIPEN